MMQDNDDSRDLEAPLLPQQPSPSHNTEIEEEFQDEHAREDRRPNENNNRNEKDKLPSLSRLASLARPEGGMLVVAIVFLTYSQVVQLLLPQWVGYAYNDLMDTSLDSGTKMHRINSIMLWVVGLHLTATVAGSLRSALMGVAGERIVARLRTSTYAHLLKQEIAFFDATSSGELVSRLGSDTTVVQQALSSAWAEVLLGVFRLVAAVALLVNISPRLAGVTLALTLTLFLLCVPFGKWIGQLSQAYQDVLGQAQTLPTEVLSSMRTVQSFGAERAEADRYAAKIGRPDRSPDGNCCLGGWGWLLPCCHGSTSRDETTFRYGYDKSVWSAIFYSCIFGGGFGAMYVTLWYGFHLVHQGHMSLGDLTAFQSYIFQIGGTLASTSGNITKIMEARGASIRLLGILDRKPKMEVVPATNLEVNGESTQTEAASAHPPTPAPAEGSGTSADDDEANGDGTNKQGSLIEFRDVSFSYPSRPEVPVIQNFNLTIPKGSTTAIVGQSGAGKSTIVALLERFYDVDSGSIFIDGVNIRSMDMSNELRNHMGLVQQEPTLFGGLTIRENIAYGRMEPDGNSSNNTEIDTTDLEARILQACRQANAYDFIHQWPKQLDTTIGERGVQLSGGQKQRIAIARAILSAPSILLFDEATSALDSESEFLVQQAIDEASHGRTVVIIAHRLSTVQNADQIVVMGDNHSIEDVGTHEELMQRCSTYQNLIARQSLGETS